MIKPLEGMGGASVFRVRGADPNVNVILETLTRHEQRYAMCQRYVPEIADGDKRLLMIDGEPIDHVLARVPSGDDARGNLAAGATGVGRPIAEAERTIAAAVGPTLREKGLLFVGLDIIGSCLTEINVTSPTCIRELDAIYGLDVAGRLLDVIDARLSATDR